VTPNLPSSDKSLSLGEARRLAVELSELCHTHAIHLRDAAFTGMTSKQANAFDERRQRISELAKQLKDFHPSNSKSRS